MFLFYLEKYPLASINNPNPTTNKIIGIQIGDNTHHHDQSIYLVNFNTMNTMVNKPPNPIPLDELDFAIIIFVYCLVLSNHLLTAPHTAYNQESAQSDTYLASRGRG
jgi:hypothetical protein